MKSLLIAASLIMSTTALAHNPVSLGMAKGHILKIMGPPKIIKKTPQHTMWIWKSGGRCFGFCHVVFKRGRTIIVSNIDGQNIWGN